VSALREGDSKPTPHAEKERTDLRDWPQLESAVELVEEWCGLGRKSAGYFPVGKDKKVRSGIPIHRLVPRKENGMQVLS